MQKPVTKPKKLTKNELLAQRLAYMLVQLNNGETLNKQSLADKHSVDIRTIERDINRLGFLPLQPLGQGKYRLDPSHLGKFGIQDVQRFAKFASVQDMFSKIDQKFFQDFLNESVSVRGFQYEDVKNRQKEFDVINTAIANSCQLEFNYTRVKSKDSRFYQVKPYKLVNKNGIWYLVAVHDNKIKVFSFTRVSLPRPLSDKHFTPDSKVVELIETGDGIYFEGVVDEVVLKVAPEVAVYFTRRNILPNQEFVRELPDGTLLLSCKRVHEQEILPLVRYWIPHVQIVAPNTMQASLLQGLQVYVESQPKATELRSKDVSIDGND